MNACRRFEEEALPVLERGDAPGAHFSSCEDCIRAREQYETLKRELSQVAVDAEPPANWQAGVWQQVDGTHKTNRSRWFTYEAPLAVAAILAWFFVVSPLVGPPTMEFPSLTAGVRSGSGLVRRGQDAQPGDVLVLDAEVGPFAHAELRVYLNERELVFSCADEPPCKRSGGKLVAEMVMGTVGVYQPALFLSDSAVAATGEGLDPDAGAVLDTGGEVKLGTRVDVR